MRYALVILASFCVGGCSGAASPQDNSTETGEDCTFTPVVDQTEAVPVYSDRAGSVPDAQNRQTNRRLIAPVRELADALSQAADDSVSETEADCALANLRLWAVDRALLEAPETFPARRQLLRFAFAFNIAVFKLQSDGHDIEPATIEWLRALTQLAVEPFRRRTARLDSADNLQIWSGVTAASFLLLDDDRNLHAHQREIWAQGIDGIGPDGVVAAELRRASRALLYHAYYLSALLWLDAIRDRIGDANDSYSAEAIARLSDRVVASVCDRPFSIPGATAAQIAPNPMAYRSLIYLTETDIGSRLIQCGLPRLSAYEAFLGGNVEATRIMLQR